MLIMRFLIWFHIVGDSSNGKDCNVQEINNQQEDLPNTKIEVAESENLIEYAEDMYNVQSRKDPSDELSLYSQKANNPIIKSSLNGGVESSLRESRASSLSSHQDWFSTGLYNVFLF